MPRIAGGVGLPFRLPGGTAPLRHRISESVIEQVLAGRLSPGDELPSSRALAAELGVGRGAVVAAYDELTAAGFVTAVAGSATRITADAAAAARAGARPHVADPGGPATKPSRAAAGRPRRPARQEVDARPGTPDVSLISSADWRRAWRRAAAAPIDHSAWVRTDHRELQVALAGHLRRTRGVVAAPEEILISPGTNPALLTLCQALGWAGQPAREHRPTGDLAIEDPGYLGPVFFDLGITARPVPVDCDGLDPALLRPDDIAAFVTPAHQYPLGGQMPLHRRLELVEWARRSGGIVIEDDYDGEFRYDVSPLPALHSLAGAADHVAYLGTASKILTPSLRLAWLIPPPSLREAVATGLERWGLTINPVTTRALAAFVSDGALSRHLARAGRTYAARRAALVAALDRHLPDLPREGVSAGLHLVVRFDRPGSPQLDDVAVVDALRDKGFLVAPLSSSGIDLVLSGLLIGYARLPESQADSLVRALADVIVTLD